MGKLSYGISLGVFSSPQIENGECLALRLLTCQSGAKGE